MKLIYILSALFIVCLIGFTTAHQPPFTCTKTNMLMNLPNYNYTCHGYTNNTSIITCGAFTCSGTYCNSKFIIPKFKDAARTSFFTESELITLQMMIMHIIDNSRVSQGKASCNEGML